MKKSQLRTALPLLIAAQVLLCAPPLLELCRDPRTTPFRFLSADAFYYLVVARNWANEGFFTFDQIHPTNGFHPLWQLFTGLIYRCGPLLKLSDHGCLIAVFLLSVVLVSAGLALVGAAIAIRRHRLPLLFLGAPVGAYALIVLPLWIANGTFGMNNPFEGPLPLYGTLWSFMNGMESGLTLAAFGAMAICFSPSARQKFSSACFLGLTGALLTMSRLDQVFIAAGVLAAHSVPSLRRHDRMALLRVAVMGLAFLIPILIYVCQNAILFGSPFPLSALKKSTFPIPHFENLGVLGSLIAHPFSDSLWLDRSYRMCQILIPCLTAVVFCATKFKREILVWFKKRSPGKHPDELLLLLFGTGLGIVALGAYNFFFVTTFGPGSWYFPISILYVTVCLLVLLPTHALEGRARLLAGVGASLACLMIYYRFQVPAGYHERYIDFYLHEAPRVKSFYGTRRPRLIEYDDGIIAYATGFPTLSGLGLAIDREAQRAMAAGALPRLAVARGFDRAASVVYIDFTRQNLKNLHVLDLSSDDMIFKVDYRSDYSSFCVMRLIEKKSAADIWHKQGR